MIEKLTQEQEQQLVLFRTECLQIGLNTEPIKRDINVHKPIIDFIYSNYLKLPSPKIWYVDSPLMFNLIINNLESNLWSNLRSNLDSNLRSNLWSNLESNLRSNLDSNLWSNLDSNLWSNLESNLRSNLESNLRSNLESNLGSNLGSNLESNLRSNLEKFENIYWGNVDVFWLSFYMFPYKYMGIKYNNNEIKSLEYLYNLCKNIGWVWYYKDICFISDRPIMINKKGILLHSETEPAISFLDGYSVWCLNGINVSRELVETPREKLDIKKYVLQEKNAEIRREAVKKIGIEKVCKDLNAQSIDKQGDYELLLLDLQDGRKRPYLKMINPSIKTYHIEGVPPEIQTVNEALCWRNNQKNKQFQEPLILT